MSILEKLINKIFHGTNISFAEAEKLLFYFGYVVSIEGSHYRYRKKGYRQIILKRRSQLKPYQIKELQEVLTSHGYNNT